MAPRDGAGKKAAMKTMAKRMITTKKVAPAKKLEPKKTAPAKAKVSPALKKSAPPRPVPTAGKPQVVGKSAPPAKAIAVVAKLPVAPAKSPVSSAPKQVSPAPMAQPPSAAKPGAVHGNAAQQAEERRKAATRKFFARLRSLEAIVGADLRKRGSLVLMQAVDQWYSEAVSATATDVSITNAAKAVIGHL